MDSTIQRLKILGLVTVLSIFGAQTALANSYTDELKQIAKNDHFRYIEVSESGLTDEIKEDLATNDSIYVLDDIKGNLKINVLDMKTKQPIKGANIYLAYRSSSYTTNSDGSSTQTANPFIAFFAGETPQNGIINYPNLYFYKSQLASDYGTPYPSGLVVQSLSVMDTDPEVVIDTNNYVSGTPAEQDATKKMFTNGEVLKFSELKARFEKDSVTKNNPSGAIENIFNNRFASFSMNTEVQLDDSTEYKALIAQKGNVVRLSELRAYIDANRELFDREVAAREYEDFGGFTPVYQFDFDPANEHKVTYKDGTTTTEIDKANVGLYIFGSNPTGGTHSVSPSSNFWYEIYVYSSDYASGRSVSQSVSYDLVDRDAEITIYLDKDNSPFSVNENSHAIYGVLKPETKVVLEGKEQYRITNDKGEFLFDGLDAGEYTLSFIDNTNGDDYKGKIFVNGNAVSGSSIDIVLDEDNSLVTIETDETAGNSNIFLYVIIGVMGAVIIALVVVVLLKRKKESTSVMA